MSRVGSKVSGRLIVEKIRRLCRHTENIMFPEGQHGSQQMQKRQISRMQVIEALQGQFTIFEQPFQEAGGDWRLTINGRCRDENTMAWVRLRIALMLKEREKGDYVVVATAFRIGQTQRGKK